jgi:class 3 adenylate cyclase
MDPQIRYVRTSDGVNIATQRLGEGTPGVPLVIAPPYAFSAAMVDWTISDFRAALMRLAARRLVVNYDPRGFGLSDRTFTELGLEERVADLAAVVDSCGPEVNILTRGPGSLYAIAYAARNPGRVRRMIMSAGYSRGRDFRLNRDRWALTRLMEENFDFYLQASALADFGWDDGKLFARDIGRHISRDALQASFRGNRQIDVNGDVPNVRCPVLVINSLWRLEDEAIPSTSSRQLAAALPHATLVEVDYASPLIFHRRLEEHLQVIEPFLEAGDEQQPAMQPLPKGTAIILFADIVDSTALTEQIGDAAFRERARVLDTALRDIISDAGGTAIEGKLLGDGVLATFPAASQAIDAALHCGSAGAEQALPLHLGLHAGDVIREQDNVFGGAVNIAARISALSARGEVLVSDVVRALARTSAGVTFEDRGEHALKGITEPQRVYAVRIPESKD